MKIEDEGDELMSVSSDSDSTASNVPDPPCKKPVKKYKRIRKYTLNVAHVPKRTFQQIQRRIQKNKPVIDVKIQSEEKTHCNRFILNQIDGDQMGTISPESITRLMWEMRDCLQRKVYGELAKLIVVFTEMPTGKSRWYSSLIKYCMIVLMYDPLVQGTGLMDMFLDGVMGCRSQADRTQFLRDINMLPNNIHVTKYDDLWTDYPLPNQLNKESVDKLCQILNDKVKIDSDNENKDSSDAEPDWESIDEDSSSDDEHNDTTTEAEIVCDFGEALDRLDKDFSK